MSKGLMAVYSNPVSPEQDRAYNEWYDEVHLKEVLEVPGVVAGTRYRLSEAAGPAPTDHRYLTVYEIDDAPEAVLAAMGARAGSLTISPALDAAGSRIVFWEACD